MSDDPPLSNKLRKTPPSPFRPKGLDDEIEFYVLTRTRPMSDTQLKTFLCSMEPFIDNYWLKEANDEERRENWRESPFGYKLLERTYRPQNIAEVFSARLQAHEKGNQYQKRNMRIAEVATTLPDLVPKLQQWMNCSLEGIYPYFYAAQEHFSKNHMGVQWPEESRIYAAVKASRIADFGVIAREFVLRKEILSEPSQHRVKGFERIPNDHDDSENEGENKDQDRAVNPLWLERQGKKKPTSKLSGRALDRTVMRDTDFKRTE